MLPWEATSTEAAAKRGGSWSSPSWMIPGRRSSTSPSRPAAWGEVLRRVRPAARGRPQRSEEHTSELQSRGHLVCRLLLEKKKTVRTGRPTCGHGDIQGQARE